MFLIFLYVDTYNTAVGDVQKMPDGNNVVET